MKKLNIKLPLTKRPKGVKGPKKPKKVHLTEEFKKVLDSIWNGNIENLKRLIYEAKFDIDKKDFSGWTALMSCAAKGQTESVMAFITAGADVNIKNTDGKTALDIAKAFKREEIVEILTGL